MKKRKTNRAKQISPGCANNGSCKICEANRLHQPRKQLQEEPHKDPEREREPWGFGDGEDEP